MTNYEMMLIFLPDLGEKNIEKELQEVKKMITSGKGEVTHEDIIGLKDLAYRIKKEEQGYYIVLNFTMDAKKCHAMEPNLNLHQALLRYLIIKTPTNYEVRSEKDLKAEAEKVVREDATTKKEKPRKSAPAAKTEKSAAAERSEAEAPKEKPSKKATEEPAETSVEKEEVAPEEEPKEEAKENKKDDKSTLDEVDAKLKSIIDDPDISL